MVTSVLEDRVKKVSLKFSENSLTISVENQISHHSSGTQIITIGYQGNNIEILLNAKYILDCLTSIDGKTSTFVINGQTNPVAVQDDNNINSQYILMPMQFDKENQN